MVPSGRPNTEQLKCEIKFGAEPASLRYIQAEKTARGKQHNPNTIP